MNRRLSHIVTLVLCMAVALCAVGRSPKKRSAAVPVQCHGYDISHHNDVVQWDKIRDAQFVYAKATEGLNYNDPCYRKHCAKARENHIPIGAYHFMSAGASGERQFEHFKRIVGKNTDLIPVLDVELDNLEVKHLREFIDACKRYYGVRPIIYVSPKRYERYREAFDGCMWWMAHHTDRTARTDYVIWQYKIDRVHGMKLDHNCLHPNYTVRHLMLPRGAKKSTAAKKSAKVKKSPKVKKSSKATPKRKTAPKKQAKPATKPKKSQKKSPKPRKR